MSPEPPVPWGHSMAVSQQTQRICAASSGGFVQSGWMLFFSKDLVGWLNHLLCSGFSGNSEKQQMSYCPVWGDGGGCLQNLKPQVSLFETVPCSHHDCS